MKCGNPFISKLKKVLIVIQGPTASGKTALGISLAKKYNSVVISADSRQFYKEMAIGTAKPTIEEMDNIPHFFIDSHSIENELTSAMYEKEALELIEGLFKIHDVLFLVGGSGMYIDALCQGLDNIPTSKEVKFEVEQDFEKNGIEFLKNELLEKDPTYYHQVDLLNPMRLIRAIEVIRLTGQPYSILRTQNQVKRSFDIKRFVINHEREKLYERINFRVDKMIEEGLVEEVKSLENYKDLNVMKTVGYSEIFEYFDGELSLSEAIEKIKMNTRRYAKRQLTWFRRNQDAIWLKSVDLEEMVNQIAQEI